MGKKDTTSNNQRVYSQAEYEHYCFAQEPFSGFVEGVGYACTEVVITAQAINRSGTEFMFDINLIGYTFDMSELSSNISFEDNCFMNEDGNEQKSSPDRSDYWMIPTFSKTTYRDDGWKYLPASSGKILKQTCRVLRTGKILQLLELLFLPEDTVLCRKPVL